MRESFKQVYEQFKDIDLEQALPMHFSWVYEMNKAKAGGRKGCRLLILPALVAEQVTFPEAQTTNNGWVESNTERIKQLAMCSTKSLKKGLESLEKIGFIKRRQSSHPGKIQVWIDYNLIVRLACDWDAKHAAGMEYMSKECQDSENVKEDQP